MAIQSSLEILKNKQTVQTGYTVTTNLGFPEGKLTERFLALKYFYSSKPDGKESLPTDTTVNDMFLGRLDPFKNGMVIGVPAERKVSNNPVLEAYHVGTSGVQSYVDLSSDYLDQSKPYQGVMNKEETVRSWDMQGVRNHLVADYPTNTANAIETNEFMFLPKGSYDFLNYGPVVRTTETLLIDTSSNMPFGYSAYEPVLAVKELTREAVYLSRGGAWIYVKDGKKYKLLFDGFSPSTSRDNVTVIDGQFVFDKVGSTLSVLELNYVTAITDNGDGTCTCSTAKKTLTLPREFYYPYRKDSSYGNFLLVFEWGDELYVLQRLTFSKTSSNPLAIYRVSKDLSTIIYEFVPEGTFSSDLPMQPFYDNDFPNQVIIGNNRLEKGTLNITPDYVAGKLKGADFDKSHNGLYRCVPNTTKPFGFSYLGNDIYAFGFVEVEPPIVSFKLDTPISKLPDETLKLTFDINIFNEDYYTPEGV